MGAPSSLEGFQEEAPPPLPPYTEPAPPPGASCWPVQRLKIVPPCRQNQYLTFSTAASALRTMEGIVLFSLCPTQLPAGRGKLSTLEGGRWNSNGGSQSKVGQDYGCNQVLGEELT